MTLRPAPEAFCAIGRFLTHPALPSEPCPAPAVEVLVVLDGGEAGRPMSLELCEQHMRLLQQLGVARPGGRG